MEKPAKPLGRKAYGSIPHLPNSRIGPGDHHIDAGQARICLEQPRDKHDRIIVTEKLDGSNVAIAKIGEKIHALGRSGYPAKTSPHEQHHHFDTWVNNLNGYWKGVLSEGEVIHGEWLSQAHGTIYHLEHDPFVAFDITRQGKRISYDEFEDICSLYFIITPAVLSDGPAFSVDEAQQVLGLFGKHGAQEMVEGAVWRVERRGEFDFMAKFVRPDKEDGKYLPEISGGEARWLWLPK